MHRSLFTPLVAAVLITGCAGPKYTVDDGRKVNEELLANIRVYGAGEQAQLILDAAMVCHVFSCLAVCELVGQARGGFLPQAALSESCQGFKEPVIVLEV